MVIQKNLISVVVPCYNQAEFLDDCLYSVLNQTYENWECIIINDGSLDNTEIIAKKWVIKDSRFKYFYKQNGGLSSARNMGIDIAKGDWVQFLDSDDCLHLDKFNNAIEIISSVPTAKLVVCKYNMFDISISQLIDTPVSYDQDTLTYENILFNWGNTFVIPIHCGIFNLSILKEIKFDENFKAVEDWIMWLSFFKITEEAVYIDRVLAFYRNNENSMTKDHVLIQNHLLKAYKYIYRTLSKEDSEKFIFKILERLSKKNIEQKARIKSLEYKNKNGLKILIKSVLLKVHLIRKK